MRRWIRELLYPQRCFLCDQLVNVMEEIPLCRQCRPEYYLPRGGRCPVCSRPVAEGEDTCAGCRQHGNVTPGRSTFLYEGAVRDSIRRFKYDGRRDYAPGYARTMACFDQDWFRKMDQCFLVPVPVHRKRRKARGYNQAQLLARELARILCVPVWEGLDRRRDTAPLQSMTARARREILSGAFEVHKGREIPEGSAVLVDDIYTSGSTVEECARTLQNAFRELNVCFWTLSVRV